MYTKLQPSTTLIFSIIFFTKTKKTNNTTIFKTPENPYIELNNGPNRILNGRLQIYTSATQIYIRTTICICIWSTIKSSKNSIGLAYKIVS